jgi:hypothetical protein
MISINYEWLMKEKEIRTSGPMWESTTSSQQFTRLAFSLMSSIEAPVAQ